MDVELLEPWVLPPCCTSCQQTGLVQVRTLSDRCWVESSAGKAGAAQVRRSDADYRRKHSWSVDHPHTQFLGKGKDSTLSLFHPLPYTLINIYHSLNCIVSCSKSFPKKFFYLPDEKRATKTISVIVAQPPSQTKTRQVKTKSSPGNKRSRFNPCVQAKPAKIEKKKGTF